MKYLIIKIRNNKIHDAGVDTPVTQSFFAYLLLTLVYGPIVLRRPQKLQVSVAA
jgi:solute carrier family 35, member F1/2